MRKHSPSGRTRGYHRGDYTPLPLFRQGPYLIEVTQEGLRLTPRPGTSAHKRWQRERARKKEIAPEVILFVIAFFTLLALSHYV